MVKGNKQPVRRLSKINEYRHKTNSPKPFHNGLHGKCVDLILQEIVEVYLYHFDHAKLIWDFLIMILSIVYIKIDLLRENTNNDALAIKK